MELIRIGHQGRQIRLQTYENINCLGECLLEQRLQALQQAIDFAPLKLGLAFARHREQLSDQRAAPRYRFFDDIDTGGDLVRSRRLLKQRRVSENDVKKIIEVVGNTAGESPDTFHFLRLQKLFMQSFALRDRTNQLFGLLRNVLLHPGVESLQLIFSALAVG